MIQDYQNIFTQLSFVQWFVVLVFVVVFLLRFFYLFLITGSFVFKRNKRKEAKSKTPLTILFTLRNEEEHIRNILPKILELEDLDIEIVVVDDFSQDNSYSVLGLLNQRYGRLKISSLNEETRYSVKLAQNIALKRASNNWVLITPITLSSVKSEWLTGFLQSTENQGLDLILGYSSVLPAKGIFNRLYRIENFYQQITNVGYIYNGVPFVYSEDNLAFKKEKYFELGGYGKNIKEPYANLELIANQFIKKQNTSINFDVDSAILNKIDISKTEYLDLLKKSYRIEKYLPHWKKFVLFVDTFTNLLYLPVFVFALVLLPKLRTLIFILIGLKFLAHLLIIKITQNRLNERKIFISSLVYGLLVPWCKLVNKWHFNRRNGKTKWGTAT